MAKALSVALFSMAPCLALPRAAADDAPRLIVHERDAEISVFARLPAGIRLMVEDGTGALIVSGYLSGKVFRILPDRNGDGRADGAITLLEGLNLPHGLELADGWLYVAEEHQVMRWPYRDGRIAGKGRVVISGMPRGGHVSRTIRRGPDGYFYLSIGSSCNVCIEKHPWRAAIIRFRPGGKDGKPEICARGLRNSVGFDWRPGKQLGSGWLYAVNAGRDWLGDDHPREELNVIFCGRHYGWPHVHEEALKDPDFWNRRPKNVRFTPPVHTFAAHSTPLSIRFLRHQPDITPGTVALIARHGSWNRSKKVGYDVVWLEFQGNRRIIHRPYVTGFLDGQSVLGRPVDVLEARDGSIYITDDHTGFIYRLRRPR